MRTCGLRHSIAKVTNKICGIYIVSIEVFRLERMSTCVDVNAVGGKEKEMGLHCEVLLRAHLTH